jgi:sugar lactone lactonase YvrE
MGVGGGGMKTIARVPDHLKIEGLTRFNDARATPDSGVLFAGYMHSKWREGKDKAGRLLKLVPNPNYQSCDPTCNTGAAAAAAAAGVASDDLPGILVTALGPDQIHLPNGSVWLRGEVGKGGQEVCYIVDSADHTVKRYTTATIGNAAKTKNPLLHVKRFYMDSLLLLKIGPQVTRIVFP